MATAVDGGLASPCGRSSRSEARSTKSGIGLVGSHRQENAEKNATNCATRNSLPIYPILSRRSTRSVYIGKSLPLGVVFVGWREG